MLLELLSERCVTGIISDDGDSLLDRVSMEFDIAEKSGEVMHVITFFVLHFLHL